MTPHYWLNAAKIFSERHVPVRAPVPERTRLPPDAPDLNGWRREHSPSGGPATRVEGDKITLKQAYRTSCAAVAMVAMLQTRRSRWNPCCFPPARSAPSGRSCIATSTPSAASAPPPSWRCCARGEIRLRHLPGKPFLRHYYFGTYPGANGLFDANGKLITRLNPRSRSGWRSKGCIPTALPVSRSSV